MYAKDTLYCAELVLIDCLISNCFTIFSRRLGPDRGNYMDVVAMAPIAEGAEIKTRYMTPQWGTIRRQQLTQNYWHFVCRDRKSDGAASYSYQLLGIAFERIGINPVWFIRYTFIRDTSIRNTSIRDSQ